jgi:hypothetical protein
MVTFMSIRWMPIVYIGLTIKSGDVLCQLHEAKTSMWLIFLRLANLSSVQLRFIWYIFFDMERHGTKSYQIAKSGWPLPFHNGNKHYCFSMAFIAL